MAALSAFHSIPFSHRNPLQVVRHSYVNQYLSSSGTISLSIFFLFCFSLFKSQKCYDLKQVLSVEPTAVYKAHLLAAQNFSIDILESTKSVDKYIAKGKFVKVKKKIARLPLAGIGVQQTLSGKKSKNNAREYGGKICHNYKKLLRSVIRH